jgi:hypothetical protein
MHVNRNKEVERQSNILFTYFGLFSQSCMMVEVRRTKKDNLAVD